MVGVSRFIWRVPVLAQHLLLSVREVGGLFVDFADEAVYVRWPTDQDEVIMEDEWLFRVGQLIGLPSVSALDRYGGEVKCRTKFDLSQCFTNVTW